MKIVEYCIGEEVIEVHYQHEGAGRVNSAFIRSEEFEEYLFDQGIFGDHVDEIHHQEPQPVEYVKFTNDWSNYEEVYSEYEIMGHIIDFRESLKK